MFFQSIFKLKWWKKYYKYKYYDKQRKIHDQEESKLNSTINVNSDAHIHLHMTK